MTSWVIICCGKGDSGIGILQLETCCRMPQDATATSEWLSMVVDEVQIVEIYNEHFRDPIPSSPCGLGWGFRVAESLCEPIEKVLDSCCWR